MKIISVLLAGLLLLVPTSNIYAEEAPSPVWQINTETSAYWMITEKNVFCEIFQQNETFYSLKARSIAHNDSILRATLRPPQGWRNIHGTSGSDGYITLCTKYTDGLPETMRIALTKAR